MPDETCRYCLANSIPVHSLVVHSLVVVLLGEEVVTLRLVEVLVIMVVTIQVAITRVVIGVALNLTTDRGGYQGRGAHQGGGSAQTEGLLTLRLFMLPIPGVCLEIKVTPGVDMVLLGVLPGVADLVVGTILIRSRILCLRGTEIMWPL